MSDPKGGKLISEEIQVTKIYNILSQEVVKITVDKLSLILTQHLRNMEKRTTWVAPLGILMTLLLVFATTDFKDAMLKAPTWEAFFVMATLLTFGWLAKAVITAIKSKSVADLVETIKKSTSDEST